MAFLIWCNLVVSEFRFAAGCSPRTTLQYMLISMLFSLRARHDLFDDDPFKEPEPFVCMRFVLVCPTLQVLQQAHEVCPLIRSPSMGQKAQVPPYTEYLVGNDVELPKSFPLAARNRTEKEPVLFAHLVLPVIPNPSGLARCIYGVGHNLHCLGKPLLSNVKGLQLLCALKLPAEAEKPGSHQRHNYNEGVYACQYIYYFQYVTQFFRFFVFSVTMNPIRV